MSVGSHSPETAIFKVATESLSLRMVSCFAKLCCSLLTWQGKLSHWYH